MLYTTVVERLYCRNENRKLRFAGISSLAGIDKINSVKNRAVDGLLNLPGVTGVDVGFKYVKGARTDEVVIRVHVKEKKQKPSQETVPDEIDGVKTDVIERRYVLHGLAASPNAPNVTRYDPLVGGISIGPCRKAISGTLGIIATDNISGAPLLLSNFHVLCIDSSAQEGVDTIVQPGLLDTGVCPGDIVGVLQRSSLGVDVDCAVASITARGYSTKTVRNVGAITGTATANLGDIVKKCGRSTGLTSGSIDGLNLSMPINYPVIGTVTLTSQITIANDPLQNPTFGNDGDSGAVVVNSNKQVIGLYVAGESNGISAIASPIGSVLTALNISI